MNVIMRMDDQMSARKDAILIKRLMVNDLKNIDLTIPKERG